LINGGFMIRPIIHTEYPNPPTGHSVTRFDHCPCFLGRQSLLAPDPICWFCKFAAFDMFSDKLPESGICKHSNGLKEREARI